MNESIKELLNKFREQHRQFSRMRDDGVFSAMCMMYLFYANPLTPFADDVCERYIVDGTNDGGIDAIFRNPDADGNEVVIIQGKFYSESNPIRSGQLKRELDKIFRTLKSFRKGGAFRGSNRMRKAYLDAHSDFDVDDVHYHIVVCTSWTPNGGGNALKDICKAYCDASHFVEIKFGDDIIREAAGYGQDDAFVKKGELKLFGKKGSLEYDNSVVVNISAKSLANLAAKGKSVLGLNLRYHVAKKTADRLVDSSMADTIRRHPENFWYFNNGIVVVCKSFKIRGKVIAFRDFSIVNGGQTTHNVFDLSKTEGLKADFPIICKVVKAKGANTKAKEEFCTAIAEHTNSQKPIKTADLKANLPEQKRLDAGLRNHGVFYIRKAGAVPPATYPRHMVATIERIGKMGLAGVMLMPGSARNKLPSMFEQDIYEYIFVRRVSPQFYADMLVVSKRYSQFRYMISNQHGRVGKGRWFDDDGERVVNHAETFVLSSLAFLAKIEKGALSIKKYWGARRKGDENELKKICARTLEVRELFVERDDDDEQRFHPLFRELCKTILKCWKKARRDECATDDISAFLKKDTTFHCVVANSLYKQFRQHASALRRAWESCML